MVSGVQQQRLFAATVAAITLLVAFLAVGMPQDAFFLGDPGVKLIAARSVNAHPERPMEVDLPTIGSNKAPFVDPFFPVHGNHAHAATSELFALTSAPLLAAFGIRGVYVLPVLGFVLAIIGCAWLAVGLDERRNPAFVVMIAAVCTPFVFYALEFWEHTPALGAAAAATALLVRAQTMRRGVLVGLLFGTAVLLRPEAIWFVVAVASGLPLLDPKPHRDAWIGAFALCLGVAAIPSLYAAWHFGAAVTPHIAVNKPLLLDGWFPNRLAFVRTWFTPSSRHVDVWSVAPAMVLAFLPLPRHRARGGRAFLWVVAIVYAALVLGTAPNDGAVQWGPRYLLFVYIPLLILASDALWWIFSARRMAVLSLIIVTASLRIDRAGYNDLRTWKTIYERIVVFVERESSPDEPVVTDLWWIDQIAATLSDKRTFLYASWPTPSDKLIRQLDSARVSRVVFVSSTSESSSSAESWFRGTCYSVGEIHAIADRDLTATHLHRACPDK
jgi:hypothetical protein